MERARRTRPAKASAQATAVRYGLRFHILPGPGAAARAREVAAFCRRRRIAEVHLFFNAEEWNRGHATEAEISALLGTFRRIVPVFRKAGLLVGLNPWITVLHCDRGRTLRDGQAFETMVSPRGMRARAVASPVCPVWRRYIADLYGRMAAAGFDILWIEDDFRFHNHAPLDWGGDFGERMLAEFSRRVGRTVGREELVAAVLAEGPVHPWRAAWMALWRDVAEENARLIRNAVAAAAPSARLGLMSSHPDVHGVEGRDWHGLFARLAINGRAVHRPHFASYGETAGSSLAGSFWLLDVQKNLRPEYVESCPEIENFPFGRFSKSDTLTFMQMALAKICGSEGLLLDLHPMTGNRVGEEPGMGELLDRSFPALALLSKRFDRRMAASGAGVPFLQDAAERLPGLGGTDYWTLMPRSFAAADLLGGLGASFTARRTDGVNVLFGRYAAAFPDDELQRLLSRGLWLDADAALALFERGYGGLIGLDDARMLDRESSLYAVERVVSRAAGVRTGFVMSGNLCPRALRFAPAAGAAVWTEVRDCMDRPVGPGLAVARNRLGGTVAVSAFPLGPGDGWNLTFQRQSMVRALLRRLSPGEPPVTVAGGPYLFPVDLRSEGRRTVAVINLRPDPAAPTVTVPGARAVSRPILIEPLRRPRPARCPVVRRGGELTVRGEVLSYGAILVFDAPA